LHGNEGVFTPDQAEAFATQKFSNIIPNLSSLLRNVETKISSDSPVSSQVMEQLASGADAAMNLSAEKLDAISSLLAANLNELKEIARHTSNTSDNISNAGGYVS
jgi:phage-related protein